MLAVCSVEDGASSCREERRDQLRLLETDFSFESELSRFQSELGRFQSALSWVSVGTELGFSPLVEATNCNEAYARTLSRGNVAAIAIALAARIAAHRADKPPICLREAPGHSRIGVLAALWAVALKFLFDFNYTYKSMCVKQGIEPDRPGTSNVETQGPGEGSQR